MNYLAHLYLAVPQKTTPWDGGLIVGGFIGDHVKGPLQGQYRQDIERGIRLHRKIDIWSDQHPGLRHIKTCFKPSQARFVGIATDVLCDHFLSRHWPRFCSLDRSEFISRCVEEIEPEQPRLPESAALALRRLQTYPWLSQYDDLDFCFEVLERIGQRLKYTNPLDQMAPQIERHYSSIEARCLQMLYDLTIASSRWRQLN